MPLRWPEGSRPKFEGARVNSLWRFVPIVGMISQRASERRMMKPILDQLDEQLLLRPPSWGCWRSSDARLEFVQLLSLLIADEMEWPNNRFLPGDALDVLLFPHSGGDGGELLEIICHMQRRVGVKVWDFLDRKFVTRSTYRRIRGTPLGPSQRLRLGT